MKSNINSDNIYRKIEFFLSAFLAIFLFMITLWMVQRHVDSGAGDYYLKAQRTLGIHFGNLFQTLLNNPYCMWMLMVKFLCVIFKTDQLAFVSGVVAGLFVLVTYIFTVMYLRRLCYYGSSVMSFIACIVGPLYMPWFNVNYYLGQGSPNDWCSATNNAVRPFAVIVFTIVVAMFDTIDQKKGENSDEKAIFSRKKIIGLIILIFASVFAKPSFVMAFIPALGIYIIMRLIRGDWKNFRQYSLLCIVFIPGIILLIYQFITIFWNGSSVMIGIEWFRAKRIWTSYPFISTFLVICFPVIYFLFNIKKEIKRVDTQLSIIYVSVGWLISNLLYQIGPAEAHGNMDWAYHIALYIVWIVALSHFLCDVLDFDITDKTHRMKMGVLSVLLSFHFFFGLKYLADLMFKAGYYC